MQFIKKSPEIYLSQAEIVTIGQKEIDFLKVAIKETPQKRVRINLHPSNDDGLHEMFIAIEKGSYIRPHKHPNKSEAFHAVYGAAKIVIFTDEGGIKEVVDLAVETPGKPFYYRLSKPYFHTLLLQTELLIIHEITNGPFIPGGTIYASFAPSGNSPTENAAFESQLAKQVASR
ncbi:MAG TPA: WbuC family cupin fold metalloprotein [Gammaproteobacteria bacterium]|nr:WbuC family cupin fold metalloprotein [Gammaproteobacteria bacterium]